MKPGHFRAPCGRLAPWEGAERPVGPAPPAKVAPASFGHYVQAKVHYGLVYVSEQLAARPDGTATTDAPFEAQVAQALNNSLAIVRDAGSAPDRILKVTAYIVSVERWQGFNHLYQKAFGDARPARSVVPAPQLRHGYLIEIDAIAALKPNAGSLSPRSVLLRNR